MSAIPAGARPDREPIGGRAASIRDPLARALLVMTFSTGLVDAVGYLGLGRVFTANMTGTSFGTRAEGLHAACSAPVTNRARCSSGSQSRKSGGDNIG